MSTQTSTEWLRMMAEFSPLTDCKPHFSEIAMEIERYRDFLASIKQLVAHASKDIPAKNCLEIIGEYAARALGEPAKWEAELLSGNPIKEAQL